MSRRRKFPLPKALEAEGRIRYGGGNGAAPLSPIQDLILTATAYATPGLRDLARAANIAESTLSSWRRGIRVPPPDAVEVLAAVLEDRAHMLSYYAGLLREGSGSPQQS